MARFYTKYMGDITSSLWEMQGHESGRVYRTPWNIAPGKRRGGPATPDWGAAIVLLPWYMYLYYGDTGLLAQHYPAMKEWADYLMDLAQDHIVKQGLGDHCAPLAAGPRECPVALTSTAYYYYTITVMADTSGPLGFPEEVPRYRELASRIKDAFVAEFFDTEQATYGSQTANAFALFLSERPRILLSGPA